MAESVGHLAALLHSGGRAGHVWGELLRFHDSRARSSGPGSQHARAVLASAAHAAELGASPALAIRKELASWPVSADSAVRVARECWERVALAVRSSELSGCPLASLLSRLALDLEQSADAEAARQSALAGPRASVALLSWLPFLGGGLGLLLGVDPVDVLLGSPLGVPVLVLGLLFWVLGRFWSRRLVAGAEGIR
ncbi:hypothetical protein [Arthrobacter sp. NPDC090010]|uniref:hypothetical protein n=1 Tax=Arthrobacter sp. NPDC090010 TaxID=3363942 RepID=UPI00381F17C7